MVWLWGAPTVGMTPAALHRCRIAAAKAERRLPLGTSVVLRMGVSKFDFRDPCLLYISKIVEMWCLTLWRGMLSQGLLGEVFAAAQAEMGPTYSFSEAVSPAHVVLKVLAGIGWAPVSGRLWQTNEG